MNVYGCNAGFYPLFKLFLHINLYFIPFIVSSTSAHAQDLPLSRKTILGGGLPKGTLIMLADGYEIPVEQIQAGDVLSAYDPAIEQRVSASVLYTESYPGEPQAFVSIMLIQEELSASLEKKGGTLGLLLQANFTQPILTQWGKKETGQLQEGDKVFCYDQATGQFHLFTVYGVSVETQLANEYYQLYTDKQNYIANGVVVLEK